MTSKQFIGLAAATAVVAAGAVAAVMSRQSATERAIVDEPALPGLMARINDVTRLSLTGPEADFALRFDGERWVAPALADFPVDYDKVKAALIGLAELRVVEEKTSDPERYGALGLADPDAEEGGGVLVRLSDAGDGEVAALTVGNPGRGGADEVYLRRAGEEATWLARGAPELGGAPKDWVDTMVLRLPGERVRRVTISHADGEVVDLVKALPADESFELATLPEGASLRSPMTLDNVGRALAFLRFDDVAAASEGPAPGAGDSTAVFETFDGVTVTVTLQKRGEENWARFDAAYDPEAAFAEPEAEEAADGEAGEAEAGPEEEEAPFDAEADFAELVSRTADWAFLIPDFKAEQLGMRLDRLIDLPSEDGEDGEGGDSELVPGALPPGVEPPPVIELD